MRSLTFSTHLRATIRVYIKKNVLHQYLISREIKFPIPPFPGLSFGLLVNEETYSFMIESVHFNEKMNTVFIKTKDMEIKRKDFENFKLDKRTSCYPQ